MPRLYIPLFLTPGLPGIYLQAIRGAEELQVDQADTTAAVELIQSMLDQQGAAENIRASAIVTADRDRVMAAVYRQLYGPRIESSVTCRHCHEKFDLDFSLDALLEQYKPEETAVRDDGIYETAEGVCFRLPTGDDELLAMSAKGMDPVQALLNQCLVGVNVANQPSAIEEKMAALAPVLNLEMQAVCPECHQQQAVRFDMQTFLLMRIKKERPRLLYEVHRIAMAYHWPHADILQLPRMLRRQYVSLIEAG
ncbi:hypothetical protein [Flavihumibacter fluvii]|uniref:T4 family baseplate hub assembly chaperone n=1 Tax=Flavihumibacter fluvii TaxID=2838157 RepID=UPI001BDF63F5|nr:hypothetical protein [Flavihumibacter fluvii]ULQ53228.1 hypothetical protein KJS93_02725 [Flavihumibacter fluvii]